MFATEEKAMSIACLEMVCRIRTMLTMPEQRLLIGIPELTWVNYIQLEAVSCRYLLLA